jgi:hypothetical protein
MNNEGSRGSSGSIVHSLCQQENSANERMKGMKDDQEEKPKIGDPGDQARDRAIESSRNPSFILHSFIRGPEVAPKLADRAREQDEVGAADNGPETTSEEGTAP